MDPQGLGNLNDLERRLREFKLKRLLASPEGLAAEGSQRAMQPAHDPVQEEVDRGLATIEIPKVFDGLPDYIDLNGRVPRYDFPDNAWADKPGIRLDHYSDKELAALGRRVVPMIASGFSWSGVAAVMVLAFNLKKPRTNYKEYMFDQDAFPHLDDKKYDDAFWSTEPFVSCGRAEPIIAAVTPQKEAAVYAYIAASLLRLFTKSPANYVKAWDRIQDGFQKFYGDPIEIMLPVPVEAAIKSLADLFSILDKAKVALYRILYCSNGTQTHAGLKRFLYDIHLPYTGMHVVSIMDDLVKLLDCSPDAILDLLQCGETKWAVQNLKQLMQLRQDAGATHTRKMWRYGRIFDDTFMLRLQTKACPLLVYTLAFALQSEDPDAHRDILNIAQLADLSEYNRQRAKVAAQRILSAVKDSVNRG